VHPSLRNGKNPIHRYTSFAVAVPRARIAVGLTADTVEPELRATDSAVALASRDGFREIRGLSSKIAETLETVR
jgi:hypothetical protein